MLPISSFDVTIEGLKSMACVIPIVNGGVTNLPPFTYTNTNPYPVMLYPSLTNASSNKIFCHMKKSLIAVVLEVTSKQIIF